jgi:hypothetical protein
MMNWGLKGRPESGIWGVESDPNFDFWWFAGFRGSV